MVFTTGTSVQLDSGLLLEEDALVLIQNSTEKEMNDEQEAEEELEEEEGRQAWSCGRGTSGNRIVGGSKVLAPVPSLPPAGASWLLPLGRLNPALLGIPLLWGDPDSTPGNLLSPTTALHCPTVRLSVRPFLRPFFLPFVRPFVHPFVRPKFLLY